MLLLLLVAGGLPVKLSALSHWWVMESGAKTQAK